MKAVLVFADGRTLFEAGAEAQQWLVYDDAASATRVNRYFKACEVAHTKTDHDVSPVGEHVLVYAEQPRQLYEGRIVTA